MAGGSSDDARGEPIGAPERETTASFPDLASVNNDLELLRLRVLASRKRKLREEGEVSDSEDPLQTRDQDAPSESPSLSLSSRPRSLSREPGSFRGRPVVTGRKRKGTGTTAAAAAAAAGVDPSAKLFQSLEMEARQFSESFHPQSCTLVLDDEDHHSGREGERPAGDDHCYEDESISGDTRSRDTSEPSPLITELRQREIARQKELLTTTRTQMALIDEDLVVSMRQLEETEKVTKVAVEKQQRLKTQLRETKALIHRSKQLKMQHLARQSALRMERGQKIKLISVLQGSILTKLQESAATTTPATAIYASSVVSGTIPTPLPCSEASGSSDKRGLKIFTDAASSSSSSSEEEALATMMDSKTLAASVAPFSRSTEISQLERKALTIQRDLIAAQISLLRARKTQQQHAQRQQQRERIKISKRTIARRAKQSRALGKVMAVTPIQPSSKAPVVEGEESSTMAPPDLGLYFPSFLHHLGGGLLEASTLGDLIQSLGEMILLYCQEREEEPAPSSETDEKVGTPDSSPNVATVIRSDPISRSDPFVKETEGYRYVPYLSPLRIFSSYRFSPCFSAFAALKQGLLSDTFTNRINPFGIVCQTELEGLRCTRRNCPGQHFKSILLSDADVLEDFMRTLLAIPIHPSSPYRDHIEVTTAVKQGLLAMTDKRVPLISLVGVLLDICRRMTDGAEHVISFAATPQPGPGGNKLTEVTSLTAVRRTTEKGTNSSGMNEAVPAAPQAGGNPPLRNLIMGVAEHRRRRGNGDSAVSRYFPPSCPAEESVGEEVGERGNEEQQGAGAGRGEWSEEGKGEVVVLENFARTLSLSAASWDKALVVLRAGLVRYPHSTLLTAVAADLGEETEQNLDTSCLSLVRALERFRSGAIELECLLFEAGKMNLSAASVGTSLVTA